MAAANEKTCVILLAMGGPDSVSGVRRYLYNIFSDRAIIRLPGGALLQKPFARMISSLRAKHVQENYRRIGGASPLLKWTESQARQVQTLLIDDIPGIECFVGMRYFDPTIASAVKAAYTRGHRRMVFLPMYPQYSTATTGSSFSAASLAISEAADAEAEFIKDFHDDQGYIALLRQYITEHIGPDDTLVFSAHSLPQRFVDEGDPYVDQIRRTARLAAGDREYFLSFQSRTGPVEWVGPDTIREVKRLLMERNGPLFVVPISFVCDHIETLFEIDIDLPEQVNETGTGRLKRMPMFNDDPRFAQVLANIVRERVLAGAEN